MKGLRIGWASPWNERSAIAQSASEVAFELSCRGHVITVLRTEVDEALTLPPRASPGPINALANFLPHQLRQDFDVVVAHIGDHYGFHGALLSRLPDVDVVGIFHDVFLADLAWMLLDGNEAAIRALRQTYGEDTWPVGEPFFNDPREVMEATTDAGMAGATDRRSCGSCRTLRTAATRCLLWSGCCDPTSIHDTGPAATTGTLESADDRRCRARQRQQADRPVDYGDRRVAGPSLVLPH